MVFLFLFVGSAFSVSFFSKIVFAFGSGIGCLGSLLSRSFRHSVCSLIFRKHKWDGWWAFLAFFFFLLHFISFVAFMACFSFFKSFLIAL